jgi:hypothetical protein
MRARPQHTQSAFFLAPLTAYVIYKGCVFSEPAFFSFPFRLFGPFFPSPLSFYPFFYERAHSSPI